MGENLVVNGGFEQDWAHHRAWRCVEGQEPEVMETGNCFVQAPWEFWWVDGPDLHLPEVKDAWGYIDDVRVHSGEKAIQYFKTWDQYHAGFWQVVEVPGEGLVTVFLASKERWGFCHNDSYWDDVKLSLHGDELVLSAWCHAWSNQELEGYEECTHDPRCSAGVGELGYFEPLPATPEPNGDPWNDAIRNVTFRLGIDPTGGTNPLAKTVRWTGWVVSYNRHHYVSRAWVVGQDVEPGEDEPEEVGYEVVVRVPAQSVESFRRVAEEAEEGLNSVVPSHDDAGRLADVVCPSGKGGLVVLYDVPEGQREAYVDWYAERYPLARVTFAEEGPADPGEGDGGGDREPRRVFFSRFDRGGMVINMAERDAARPAALPGDAPAGFCGPGLTDPHTPETGGPDAGLY